MNQKRKIHIVAVASVGQNIQTWMTVVRPKIASKVLKHRSTDSDTEKYAAMRKHSKQMLNLTILF